MHAADSSSSYSSSSSATHLPFLLTPAQTTESQNDLGSWEPLQTIASSLYTTTHTTKENKTVLMKKELQYQALPKLQLLFHLTTTTIFTTHCCCNYRCCCWSLSICISVRLSLCLCLSPEFKSGSFSAHKLFNRLKMEKTKRKKKGGFRKSTTTTIEAKQMDFSNYKYCKDLSVVLNKKLRSKNSNSPRQVQAS